MMIVHYTIEWTSLKSSRFGLFILIGPRHKFCIKAKRTLSVYVKTGLPLLYTMEHLIII